MKVKIIIQILILLGFIGCATSKPYQLPPNFDLNKTANIHLYRTNVLFHSLNLEKPFFYIGEKFIGKLGTGDTITIRVLPGKHTIKVKKSFLFMPSFTNGTIKLHIEKNNDYYVRYSKDFSNILMTSGSSAIATGKTTLQLVDKNHYLELK